MNKIVTVLIAGLLLLASATYSQTSFSINPSTINGNTGENVTVEVVVDGFTDIVSMQYAIKWDPTVIKFVSVGDYNLDFLLASNFNVDPSNTDLGILPLSWFDNNTVGITVPNGTAIFSVTFEVLNNSAGSLITFSEATNLIIEITDTSGDVTNSVTFNDGQFGDPNNNNGGGNTSPLISGISSGSGMNGTTVCVNVSVSNFTDITEMQYSLNWNSSVLQFAEIRNMNLSGLTQSSFGTSQTANGRLSIDWSNATGFSVPNGTIIYQVCFNLIGDGGTSSAISFSGSPSPISVTTTASSTSVGISGSNGTIGVTGGGNTGSTDFRLVASTETGNSGEQVCVQVSTQNFTDIVSMQYSMNWNSSVLRFDTIQGINLNGLSLGSFNTAVPGELRFTWDDPLAQGITLSDNTVIYEICFTIIGSGGTSTAINFANAPTPIEIIDGNDNEVPFTSTAGSVTVISGIGSSTDFQLIGSTETAEAGEQVCVQISTQNFDDIISMQYSMNWDPTVLRFDTIQGINLNGLSTGNFNTSVAGELRFTWDDPLAQGITLADNTTIYELCFVVIGSEGNTSTVGFSGSPTPIEIIDGLSNEVPFTSTAGVVTVTGGIAPPNPDAIFIVRDTTTPPGSKVCVPVVLNNFTDILGFQFSMNWNPAIIRFDTLINFGLAGLSGGNFNTVTPDNGTLRVTWTDPVGTGATVVDGTVAFEICYDVLGADGTSSNVSFTNTPIAQELINNSGEIEFISDNGIVRVSNEIITPPVDLTLSFSDASVREGESICLPVTVNGFTGIEGMQYSINWDPTVLQYDTVRSLNLDGLSVASFNNSGAGDLRLLWQDPNAQGITLVDGTSIYEVCFVAVGASGTSTNVGFSGNPLQIEIVGAGRTVNFNSQSATISVTQGITPIDGIFNVASVTSLEPKVCIPVTLNDFTDILGFQFSMSWDPTVIQFDTLINFGLPGLSGGNFNTVTPDNGTLRATWTDPLGTGLTVDNGTTVFELCFDVVGQAGESSIIAFANTPIVQELIATSGTIDFTSRSGIFTIGDPGNDCPSPISAIPNAPTNVSCPGANDGSISLVVSGGNGIYNYQWSDPNIGNTPNPTGLAPGVYNVTITSCGGQEVVSNLPASLLTITEPTEITTVVTPQDAACAGEASGRINVSIEGGTGDYSYTWSNATLAPLNRPVNALPGTYSLTITDTNGCTDVTENIVIGSPTAIAVSVATTNATCSGRPNGTATLNASGGSGGDYIFDWGVAEIIGANPTNVPSGDYTVTVTDGNQCTSSFTVSVGTDTVVTGTYQAIEDACGDSKGAINVIPTGGATPYSYTWTGPVDTSGTATLSDIPKGIYTVRTTDANGCFFILDIEVDGPETALAASQVIQSPNCPEDTDGSITVSPSGGFAPYTYEWSTSSNTTSTLSNIGVGTYTVTITDSKICTLVSTYAVNSVSNLAVEVTITQPAPNGTAQATISGGIAPFDYMWCLPDQNGAIATGLSEGDCSVTVIDAQGCEVVESFEVNADQLEVQILVSSPISCNGAKDGALQAMGTGGAAPYTYLWNSGATSNILVNIGAGNYTVTITDNVGATTINSFTLEDPDPIVININDTKLACEGDGRIEIGISGGTMPYRTAWSNGATNTFEIANLLPGEYGLVVTDENDCVQEQAFTLNADPGCDNCYIAIPVITPNDDAVNDDFIINCVSLAPNNRLEIYNRWGELVFEMDNYACEAPGQAGCWQGERRGIPLPPGGYFWVLEYDGPNGRVRIRDHVTIRRD